MQTRTKVELLIIKSRLKAMLLMNYPIRLQVAISHLICSNSTLLDIILDVIKLEVSQKDDDNEHKEDE